MMMQRPIHGAAAALRVWNRCIRRAATFMSFSFTACITARTSSPAIRHRGGRAVACCRGAGGHAFPVDVGPGPFMRRHGNHIDDDGNRSPGARRSSGICAPPGKTTRNRCLTSHWRGICGCSQRLAPSFLRPRLRNGLRSRAPARRAIADTHALLFFHASWS